MSKVIGVIGSHCTGKTTLVKNLSKLFENDGYKVGIVTETARYFPREELGKFETQYKITRLLVRRIDELIDTCDIILTDRTPLDCFAYTIYYMINNDWDPDLYEKIRDEWNFVFKITNNLYDLIIYSDNIDRIQIEDDGFRLTDRKSRNFVDIIIRTLLHSYRGRILIWRINMDTEMLYKYLKYKIGLATI